MAAHQNRKQGAEKALSPFQQRLLKRLENLKPSKAEAQHKLFREAFPMLEVSLAQSKLLKDVLATFNEEAGTNVCSRTFKEWLESERKFRAENGDVACCVMCGKPLTTDAAIGPDEGSDSSRRMGEEE